MEKNIQWKRCVFLIDRFTYKEVDYANCLIENGFMTQYINYEMSLICKYWRDIGMTKREVKENLSYFCSLYVQDYDEFVYYKKINSIVNKIFSSDLPLIQIDYVEIYEHEVEYIKNMNYPHNYKRFVFSMLVLKKIYAAISSKSGGDGVLTGYLNCDSSKIKTLKHMAHLKGGKKDDPDYMLFDLSSDGYVNILALTNVYLNFINDMNMHSSNIAIRVNDFERVWMYWDYLIGYNRGGKIKLCENCGRPYHLKSNRQKYCEVCSGEIKRKNDRDRISKKRSVS